MMSPEQELAAGMTEMAAAGVDAADGTIQGLLEGVTDGAIGEAFAAGARAFRGSKLGKFLGLSDDVAKVADDVPSEPYSRRKHYGNTPTKSDRNHFGAGSDEVIDHKRPLVKHYYDGDGKGGKPGFRMTPSERKAYAKDRNNMQVQSRSESNSQGGKMSNYSREKKKQYNFRRQVKE